MEQLFGMLQSALALTARQGWIWFCAGAGVLLLNRAGIAPFAVMDKGWLLVAGVAAVFGVAILLISLVGYVFDLNSSRRQEMARSAASNAEFQRYRNEAVANLDVLNDIETTSLVWILRNGQKRFRAEFRRHDGNNLVAKRIVGGPVGATNDVFVVMDSVWEKREELLSRFSQIHVEKLPPWERPSLW